MAVPSTRPPSNLVQTAEFFEVILPSAGLRCVAVPNKKSATGAFLHKFYEDSDTAAEVTQRYDARGDVPVYFGCASYCSADSRKGENVAAVRSFWLDIDCGEGKGYATQRDAILALAAFRKDLHLPAPYLVNSGAGLHAYWPMAADMSPDEWREVATALKIATRVKGLHVDQSRTADITSVLRAVGTTHRKGAPKPVRLLHTGMPSPLASFREALKDYFTPMAPAPHRGMNGAGSLNSDLSGGLYQPMPNAAAIAQGCGVLKLVMDTKGDVDQPTWYHALGVIGFCEDGATIAQDWSSGHAKYSAHETSTKLTQALSFKPTTCAKFEDYQPAICAACPHYRKLVSPIKLGYEQHAPPAVAGPSIHITIPRVELPFGYHYKTDTKNPHKYTLQVMMPIGENKALEAVPFCNTLFYPVARIHTDEGNMLEIEMRQRGGVLKRFNVNCSTIAAGGPALASELGRYEIVAYPGMKPQIEAFLSKNMDLMKERSEEIKTHNRFGWHGDNFLLGNTLITPTEQRKVLLSGDAAELSSSLTAVGDLETWVSVIDQAYNYEGQEALQYLVLVGFAAPLFSMFKDMGGVTVYAHSQGSGVGKTTAQRAGLSAWGDWRKMQLAEGKATLGALWTYMGTYCHLPVVFDELTNALAGSASDVVYSVAQGEPRIRLNQDGTLKPIKHRWSTFMMASGNALLTEKLIVHRPNPEAEIVRAFEFTVPSKSRLTPNEARDLFPKLLDHRGLAGLKFMDYIVKNRARVHSALMAVHRSFNTQSQVSQSERYWSGLQACVLTALRICNKLNILAFPEPRMHAWIAGTLGSNRVQRDESVSDSLETFGKMLNDIWLGFLVTKGEGDARKNLYATVHTAPKIALVGRVILSMEPNEKDILLLNVKAVHEWCAEHGASAKDMFEAITAKGWCETLVQRYSLGKGVTGFSAMTSQVKCWVIDYRKMSAESRDHMIAQRLQLVERSGDEDHATAAGAIAQ